MWLTRASSTAKHHTGDWGRSEDGVVTHLAKINGSVRRKLDVRAAATAQNLTLGGHFGCVAAHCEQTWEVLAKKIPN